MSTPPQNRVDTATEFPKTLLIFVSFRRPAQLGEPLENDLTTPRGMRSEEDAQAAAEAQVERANGGLHVGSLRIGFYEWVEYLTRVAYLTHNGKKEGIAWALDRMMISVVPDDVAMAILPWECYGGTRWGLPQPAACLLDLFRRTHLSHISFMRTPPAALPAPCTQRADPTTPPRRTRSSAPPSASPW